MALKSVTTFQFKLDALGFSDLKIAKLGDSCAIKLINEDTFAKARYGNAPVELKLDVPAHPFVPSLWKYISQTVDPKCKDAVRETFTSNLLNSIIKWVLDFVKYQSNIEMLRQSFRSWFPNIIQKDTTMQMKRIAITRVPRFLYEILGKIELAHALPLPPPPPPLLAPLTDASYLQISQILSPTVASATAMVDMLFTSTSTSSSATVSGGKRKAPVFSLPLISLHRIQQPSKKSKSDFDRLAGDN